ncbi:MAG: ferredoxin-thioredoxin reductase catalytic domain-containing protein [Candidatus Hermodarchaeota archaeon]
MSPPEKKTKDDTYKFARMVSNKQNWKLNSDKEFLDMLMEGLTINYNRYGYFSCPCRDAAGVKARDKDIICPCDYAVPDQQDYGHCYCGLFLTQDFFASNKPTRSIPERRPDELEG